MDLNNPTVREALKLIADDTMRLYVAQTVAGEAMHAKWDTIRQAMPITAAYAKHAEEKDMEAAGSLARMLSNMLDADCRRRLDTMPTSTLMSVAGDDEKLLIAVAAVKSNESFDGAQATYTRLQQDADGMWSMAASRPRATRCEAVIEYFTVYRRQVPHMPSGSVHGGAYALRRPDPKGAGNPGE